MKKFLSVLMFFVFYTANLFSQNNNCGNNNLTVNASCVTTNYNIQSTFTNSMASPSCATSYRDGWFSFTATSTSTTITVTNDNRRMGFAVYSGSCGSLTELACQNEASGGAGSLTINITTTVSTTYRIRIMRTNNAGGNNMTGTVCVFNASSGGTSPGGVSSGIELWLKADKEAFASTWKDQSVNNRDFYGAGGTIAPSGTINYNPTYVFNNSRYWQRNGFDLDRNVYPDLNVFHVHNITTNGMCGSPWGSDASNGGANRFMNKGSWGDMDNGIVSIAYGYNLPSGVVEVVPIFAQNEPLISNIEFDYNVNNGSSALKNNYQIVTFKDQTGTYAGNALGIGNDGDTDEFEGEIPEFIVYSKLLSTNERTKISTYLAIKYGITLDNTGGGTQGDYIATDNSNIWDAYVNSSYHNDVIGIGRDDDEELEQKQSHTLDDITRIYISSLQSSNSANTGSFSNDVSYVVMGHNTGAMCANAASMAEMPGTCGLYSRIEREWKVTKTNMGQAINIDLTLAPCAIPSSVNINDLRLLVDNDGNFANGGTNCYYNGDGSGIVITYSAPIVTISNISNAHLPNNTTSYITLGSIDIGTPLPIKLVSFTADCVSDGVLLKWTTESETNNDYYSIEKSTDGINFYEVAQITGNGNSTTVNHYQWVDESRSLSTNYYRLKQTDFDGNYKYSNIIASKCERDDYFKIYPNPFTDKIIIDKILNKDEISIYNVLGQNISSHITITHNGQQTEIVTTNLPVGMYIIKTETLTVKMHKTTGN